MNPLRYFWRVAQVGVVTALFALAFVLGLPFGRPRLLRWYFQTCGHGFVKLGQVLAMRYDLLPMAYCEALASLLDQMPTVPLAKLLTIIERDLGRPWPEIYRHIDSEALGSASIAQVHGAELVDGRRVVIKVLRPHSRTYFRIDFFNARLFARFFDSLGLIPSLNLRLLTEEVIQLTEEELDFRREAQNIDLLHRQLESDGLAHTVPQVVPQGCGEQVVTMERMDGIWLKDVLVADPADLPSNLDRPQLAALLFESILVQIFRHRLFHADPHAANILIRPDGSLGYVDFGLVGWVDEKVWEQQARLYQAIGQEQVQAAYDAILDSMQPLPALDLTDFEREVKALLHDWIAVTKSEQATLTQKSSGYFLLKVFDAVRRAGLRIPIGMMRVNRALIIADVIILKLDPHMNRLPILERFFREELPRVWFEQFTGPDVLQTMQASALTWMYALQRIPALLDRLARLSPEDLGLSGPEPPRDAEGFRSLLRLLANGTLLAALIIFGGGVIAPLLDGRLPGIETLTVSGWLAGGGALVAAIMLRNLIRTTQ